MTTPQILFILIIAILLTAVIASYAKRNKAIDNKVKPYLDKRNTKELYPQLLVRLSNISKGTHLHTIGLRSGKFTKIIKYEGYAIAKTKLTRLEGVPTYCKPLMHKGFVWVHIHNHNFKEIN